MNVKYKKVDDLP